MIHHVSQQTMGMVTAMDTELVSPGRSKAHTLDWNVNYQNYVSGLSYLALMVLRTVLRCYSGH